MPGLIRVAFTSLAPFVSGAERSLQVTLRHLPAAGIEPVLIGPPGCRLAPWCRDNGIPFLPAPLAFRDRWHPVRWWRCVRRVRSLLRHHRIDLAHANQMWSYPGVGVAARELGLPAVCHLRDDATPDTLRWCCPVPPTVAIAISRHIARQAEAAWPSAAVRPRVETRLNPVDLPGDDARADGCRLRAEARSAFGIPPVATVLGFIGQIREVKGLCGLLDALAGVRSDRPWHLLVAGRDTDPGAPYEARCRARADRPDLAGRVRFLGFLDDTTRFYQALDVAVVPSAEEPMGRVPLEAAAHGRPSVAFAVGGLPDVIRDGRTGWLVPAADWSALGATLARVIDAPDPTAGRTARAWAAEVADPVRYAHWLAGLYHRLGGRPPAGTNPPPGDRAAVRPDAVPPLPRPTNPV